MHLGRQGRNQAAKVVKLRSSGVAVSLVVRWCNAVREMRALAKAEHERSGSTSPKGSGMGSSKPVTS